MTPPPGVMVGRFAYNHPWAFRHADSAFYGREDPGLTRREIVEQYLDYGAVMLVGGWVECVGYV